MGVGDDRSARHDTALRPGRLPLGAARLGFAGSVPHCHSEEEEVFVILEGDATLELWPSPVAEARGVAEREDIPIRAGHVVARPPGTRIGHSFGPVRTG